MPEFPEYELVAGGRKFNLLGVNPAWVYHTLGSGTLTGVRPVTDVQTDPALVYPAEVKAGIATFADLPGPEVLNAGGLFFHLAKEKKPVLVKGVDLSGAGAITTIEAVRFDNPATVMRSIQALCEASPFVPFILAPNEMIKVVAAGQSVGFFACINEGIEQVF